MKKKIKIAVIPAAGMGTRISELPLTRLLPKPMLPLLDKPILEYIILWLKEIGIETVYLVVSFKKEVFKDYFGSGKEFGIDIQYLECPDPENIGGLADGIYLAQKFIKEPFITVLGDDFTVTKTGSYEELTETFFKKDALVLETVVKEKDEEALRRSCAVNLSKNGRIIDIVEKPDKPKWQTRGCGIYVFDPIVFDYIKKTPVKNGKKNITETIRVMAKETEKAFGLAVKRNININTLRDFNEATLTVLGRI